MIAARGQPEGDVPVNHKVCRDKVECCELEKSLLQLLGYMTSSRKEEQEKSVDAIISALDKGLYGYSAELAQRHLQEYPRDDFAWAQLARGLTQLSRYTEAEEALHNALQYAFKDAHIQAVISVLRGDVYARQGQRLQAEEWYRKAVKFKPDYAGYYVTLGISTFRRGDLELAEQIFRQGAACGGECADESYGNLGGVLVAQQRYEEAAECYQKALELTPDYKWVKLRLRDVKKAIQLKSKQ